MLTSNSTAASAGSTGSWSLGRSGLFSDFSSGKTVAIVHHIPCTSNAPVQARWARAQRAGISTPNPPTVACNRLLGGPHSRLREIFVLLMPCQMTVITMKRDSISPEPGNGTTFPFSDETGLLVHLEYPRGIST